MGSDVHVSYIIGVVQFWMETSHFRLATWKLPVRFQTEDFTQLIFHFVAGASHYMAIYLGSDMSSSTSFSVHRQGMYNISSFHPGSVSALGPTDRSKGNTSASPEAFLFTKDNCYRHFICCAYSLDRRIKIGTKMKELSLCVFAGVCTYIWHYSYPLLSKKLPLACGFCTCHCSFVSEDKPFQKWHIILVT